MVSKKKPGSDKEEKDNPATDKKKTTTAHGQAEKDIRQDPDLAPKTNPEDKMDEGELARFEGEDG